MKRISVLLPGLLVLVALGACGTSNTTTRHVQGVAGSSTSIGTGTTTEPASTTLLTIPPAPGPAAPAAPATPGPTGGAGTGNGPCSDQSSVAVTVVPDVALNGAFRSYGDIGGGATWTGGDGTESVALADGRELWFFADSYLGTIRNGQWIQTESHFLHNTMVVERKGVLTRTLHKRLKKGPFALVNPVPSDPAHFGFWPGPMIVNGTALQVIGLNVQYTGTGAFEVLGNSLATLALPSLKLVGLQALPPSGTDWSGGFLNDGGYTYLYGSSGRNTYTARVVGTNLAAPWSFYDGSGWTSNPGAAVPIENIGTKSHFSVSKVGSRYVFITKTSWETNDITAAFGCSPVGPFGSPQPIYATSEGAAFPSGDGVVTYGAFAHPELSPSPNTLVVSYDVSALGPAAGTITDASIDRPRFLDVTFS